VAGYCECGNEPLGSVKYGEFLDWLRPVSFSGRTVLEGVCLFVNHAGSWPMNRVSIPGRSKLFFTKAYGLAVEPIQPPIKWVQDAVPYFANTPSWNTVTASRLPALVLSIRSHLVSQMMLPLFYSTQPLYELSINYVRSTGLACLTGLGFIHRMVQHLEKDSLQNMALHIVHQSL
jgi:hypothetical protein